MRLLALSFLIGLTACAGLTTAPQPSSQRVERLDLKVAINGKTYLGWGVVPAASKYDVTVYPSASNNRIQWRTCDRENVIDKNDDSGGWLSDLFGSSSPSSYSFSFVPDPSLDQKHHCPLEIDVVNADKNANGFAVFEFKDKRPEYTVGASLTCNGVAIPGLIGVGMCESAVGLMQRIVFDQPVQFGDPEPQCNTMKDIEGKHLVFEFAMPLDKCQFNFRSKDQKSFRLFTHGYNDVPVRK